MVVAGRSCGGWGFVSGGGNFCKHAAVIAGDNIIMFGLAVDYVLQDSALWT